ncbi:hypothetical protein [Hymenobacter glacieicola]|uniref:Bro-N domain-containing protein n=1 Tax=Hymenobacter glacieicola TaxID=1562124 RepID=A0ABQ1X766_9BACT|nr:hypothetical protein [Hymenobacter glacieicola]GGG61160.1 hypothetical protein GCM10011378_41460 [Hymenobacter glacieicola]
MPAKDPQYIHAFGKYDPTKLKANETILDRWPELAVNDVFVTYGQGDNDKYLRYCLYLGQGSGLHRSVTDWGDRKREALRLAGIAPGDPRAEKILTLTDDGVSEMRWQWMRVTSNRKFRAYVAGCEAFEQTCEKVEAAIPEAGAGADEPKFVDLSKGKPANNDLKADAEMRTYTSRIAVWRDLHEMEKELSAMEADLFFGDKDMEELSVQKMAEENGTSWEDIIHRERKK